jgi:hypothetical protein
MNAILIHPEGRAEVVFGEFIGDLTQVAVLTQAALSALEAGGACEALQSRHASAWITLLPASGGRWLRLSHAPGMTVEEARAWAATLPLPCVETERRPQRQGHELAFPEVGKLTSLLPEKPASNLVTTLADALNVQMP